MSQSLSAQPASQAIDAVMQRLYKPADPGAAVLVVKNGKIIFEKAYGLANLSTRAPVTPLTNFRMASVSKQFTAFSILLLAERGKLRLDDSLKNFFSGLSGAMQAITVRQLLTHTSGIPDYEALIPPMRKEQVLDEDVLQLIKQRDTLYFSPGTRFRYSNTGYCLLALIAARVSGLPYADFVRNNIFAPLQMLHSQVYEKGKKMPGRAYGYHPDGGRYLFADQSITSATKGDGGVYISLRDYLKWSRALEENTLLSKAWTDRIFRAHAVVSNGVGYGYGWFTAGEKDGTSCQFHSGESTGFHNIVFRNPGKNLLLVIFSNRDDDAIAEAFEAVAGILKVRPAFLSPGQSLFRWLSKVYGDE